MSVVAPPRQLGFADAIREALQHALETDPNVFVMGLGVPDPKGVFGTTLGLAERFGAQRVLDMPCSENAMTGVAIGAALVGRKPVMVHQRLDFALLAVEQIVNQAAKWSYMFGGQASVPLVIRLIVGRGWGQGAQHSQSLHSWFAHIPGLRVVMPTTPADAKGLLLAAIDDPNPVIFIEHRWLHGTVGPVCEQPARVPLGCAKLMREGDDLSIVSASYGTLEALRAAEVLAGLGVEAEVVDLRSIRPLDEETVLASVKKTGRLLAFDLGWRECGLAAEIVALVTEQAFAHLHSAPRRLTLPPGPTPAAPRLACHYYPRHVDIVEAACGMVGKAELACGVRERDEGDLLLDVPDPSFRGPF